MMEKGKPYRNGVFTVNLKHDCVFTVDPFRYLNGDKKQITDIDFEVDLYVEHHGYKALDIKDQAETMAVDESNESIDSYCSSDDEDLTFMDFHTKGDDNVVIENLTTNDPFLNKLCSNSDHFRGFIDEPLNANVLTVADDLENTYP
uniref:Zinc finger, PMZ-type n=1 Tax=Tanacetum cinerariifolium TaxID=118510 RepID=A0A6L2N084_TANCI|nr:zinc finger, PMZ-type [Tanacetum cinerariifolium]